jgi:tRNA nucleotidyltransferase (CCA-adding enzyme)
LSLDIARRVAEAAARAGGRAVVVGGYVRDRIRGFESKDVDIEVFGLSPEALERLLSELGEVVRVGKAFGVFRVKGVDIDFSLPRRDSKVRAGHRGFEIEYDPNMSFAEAARRRDLTMNSIGLDPLTGEILDPHGGREDVKAGRLRATDPRHFPEDPLRGLRVAGFAARFEMTADDELVALCRKLDLSELSPERVFEELQKLLLRSRKPSIGFYFLRETGLLRFFPEIAAMVGVPQEPEWHPEGDVFLHTMMVLDEAAALRRGEVDGIDAADDDLALMFGALCHDIGKPSTTDVIGGRITSREHDVKGVPIAESFLLRLRAPKELTRKVGALVRYHLAPAFFYRDGASARAYRRLARELAARDVRPDLLVRVAEADHLGRTTEDALARTFPAGEHFLNMMESLSLKDEAPRDVVLGRHLVARGLRPGPEFGRILARCRDVQDETGWTDPGRILERVLKEDRG